jgi:coproporphyrinogen III oxidase
LRERCALEGRKLQDAITTRLEELDGRFREDLWTRPGGGGGCTRVLAGGELFEKAGVNYSEVYGELSEEFGVKLPGEGRAFYATGVSLVLHPRSPRVPTVHANFRYIEKGDLWWFGGGSDLTPCRLYEEDARHFHRVWKDVCDRHDPSYYARFKKWCDEYFYLPHRGETRGIGGIFFDDLTGDAARLFRFWKDAGSAFLEAYIPLVEKRRSETFSQEEREHQLLRRGRYVEFNLLYDRGTVFGLKTSGRVESILMSLPPLVRWDYVSPDQPPRVSPDQPPRGGGELGTGPEAELLKVLRKPRDWLGEAAKGK